DRAEQAAVQVPVAPGEQVERGHDVRVAAPSVAAAAVAVVTLGVAVEAQPHAHAELVEEPEEILVEAHAVALQADVEPDAGIKRLPDGADRVRDVVGAGEKRVAAVP